MSGRPRGTSRGSVGFRAAVACLLAAGPAGAQEIIELPAEDRWLDAGFEEVYRVGSLAGEEWEQFGRVRRVAFDGAGQLYVFDAGVDRIFVVGPNGEFRRAFGRQGEGPGEFRRPDGLAVFPSEPPRRGGDVSSASERPGGAASVPSLSHSQAAERKPVRA